MGNLLPEFLYHGAPTDPSTIRPDAVSKAIYASTDRQLAVIKGLERVLVRTFKRKVRVTFKDSHVVILSEEPLGVAYEDILSLSVAIYSLKPVWRERWELVQNHPTCWKTTEIIRTPLSICKRQVRTLLPKISLEFQVGPVE